MARTMSYQDELNASEWYAKRQLVLERDHYQCSHCHNKRYLTDMANLYPITVKQKKADPSSEYVRVNRQSLLLKNHPALQQAVSRLREQTYEDKNTAYVVLRDHEPKAIHAVLSVGFKYDRSDYLKQFNYIWKGLSKNNPQTDEEDDLEIENPANNITSEYIETIWKWHQEGAIQIRWHYGWNIHVHHTYYQQGRSAWQYPDEALLTLCYQCHHELHDQLQVPVRDAAGQLTGEHMTPCYRCCGEGKLEEYNYHHQGICFHCRGARYEELIPR